MKWALLHLREWGGATSFVTDYQAIGINPVNLGWPSKHEGLNYALGLTFIAGGGCWEGGIASRDAITFFVQNGPTLSLSTGFMRFRF